MIVHCSKHFLLILTARTCNQASREKIKLVEARYLIQDESKHTYCLQYSTCSLHNTLSLEEQLLARCGNSITSEVEAGGLGGEGHPWLHSKCEARVGYMRSGLK